MPMVMESAARKRARREAELARWKSPLETALLVWKEKKRPLLIAVPTWPFSLHPVISLMSQPLLSPATVSREGWGQTARCLSVQDGSAQQCRLHTFPCGFCLQGKRGLWPFVCKPQPSGCLARAVSGRLAPRKPRQMVGAQGRWLRGTN